MKSLAQQMASYGSYHRDRRNRLTHFVGVPLIIFAILIPMSLLRVSVGVGVSLAELFVLAVLIYYLVLDSALAIALGVIIAPLLWIADSLAQWNTTTALAIFLACFVVGWAIQLLGHRFEGNRPALLDNLFQIFAAPIFLAGEAAFALGLRGTLRREVEQGMAQLDRK
ncbi:Mpo1-like protein [Telmatospirillum sp.]|uniref:Mpo1 family 2-hydroxy fatty acid dioxygenase n=1 Tax=Telmatospirillum sp. TaxID=2079197 RepID=UPI002847947E|nr:Mpo1-like protein [Telmatospirillum sp.]MDR3437682.1 DUF962 domain-containing protein [Telmatospirillum sp.]